MSWFNFKTKAHKMEINLNSNASVKRERLIARAERITALLDEQPGHPKRKVLKEQLKAILRTLEARESQIEQVIDRLNGNG
jgi:hypothetical protein